MVACIYFMATSMPYPCQYTIGEPGMHASITEVWTDMTMLSTTCREAALDMINDTSSVQTKGY